VSGTPSSEYKKEDKKPFDNKTKTKTKTKQKQKQKQKQKTKTRTIWELRWNPCQT